VPPLNILSSICIYFFEPKEKTLSEKDIDQISKKIISTVQDATGANLRS